LAYDTPQQGAGGYPVKKRRLLLIASESLFGTGIVGLLEERKDQLMIEKVPDVKTALAACGRSRPDVVVYFREKSVPEEERLLNELVGRHHTRLIHCTLEANHITIYDKKQIQNAAVEDLLSAVLKTNSLERTAGLTTTPKGVRGGRS
jgi:hypothetical protein